MSCIQAVTQLLSRLRQEVISSNTVTFSSERSPGGPPKVWSLWMWSALRQAWMSAMSVPTSSRSNGISFRINTSEGSSSTAFSSSWTCTYKEVWLQLTQKLLWGHNGSHHTVFRIALWEHTQGQHHTRFRIALWGHTLDQHHTGLRIAQWEHTLDQHHTGLRIALWGHTGPTSHWV